MDLSVTTTRSSVRKRDIVAGLATVVSFLVVAGLLGFGNLAATTPGAVLLVLIVFLGVSAGRPLE